MNSAQAKKLPIITEFRARQSQLPEDLQREVTEWAWLVTWESFPRRSVCNLMFVASVLSQVDLQGERGMGKAWVGKQDNGTNDTF